MKINSHIYAMTVNATKVTNHKSLLSRTHDKIYISNIIMLERPKYSPLAWIEITRTSKYTANKM